MQLPQLKLITSPTLWCSAENATVAVLTLELCPRVNQTAEMLILQPAPLCTTQQAMDSLSLFWLKTTQNPSTGSPFTPLLTWRSRQKTQRMMYSSWLKLRTMSAQALQAAQLLTMIPIANKTVALAISLLAVIASPWFRCFSKRKTSISLKAIKLSRVGKMPSHNTDKPKPLRR